jgi:hypothetical protein
VRKAGYALGLHRGQSIGSELGGRDHQGMGSCAEETDGGALANGAGGTVRGILGPGPQPGMVQVLEHPSRLTAYFEGDTQALGEAALPHIFC